VAKVARIAYRRFIAPSKTGQAPLIDCLDDTVRSNIAHKIQTVVGIDTNMFDGAQQQVVEHMSKTSFLKFFESDIFIDYVQSVQTLADMSEVNSSKYSGTHSSASSVSGRASEQRPQNIHPDPTSRSTTVLSSVGSGGSVSKNKPKSGMSSSIASGENLNPFSLDSGIRVSRSSSSCCKGHVSVQFLLLFRTIETPNVLKRT
jgi:hypothetical protein